MDARFAGRVAIVTGGASGIGAATARALAAEGAGVLIVDVDTELGPAVASEIGATFVPGDVAEEGLLARVIDDAARRLGRLDVLVSNAFATSLGTIERLDLESWRRTLEVTLTAVFTGLKVAVPIMRGRGGGAVVNVASVSGLAADRGLAAYNAAKAGVVNLTRTAALELAPAKIRVNAVCPGLIATPALARALRAAPEREARARAAVPFGRFGRPEEVAHAICFLASDDASYVTGTTLVVDGGLTAGTGIPDFLPEE